MSTNREELVTNAVIYAKAICEENEIEIYRRSRCRQKNTQCVEISYETEIRREMFSSIDRIIQEIKTRFEQIHNLSNKFSFLFPKNLLDSNFLCNLTNDFEGDINVHEFYIERKRLQCFFAVHEQGIQSNMLSQGPYELLQFLLKNHLSETVPNLIILIRIFLTIGISVASCERSFSKLKLIKNYSRSTMSTLRLSNLAILSIEHKLTNEVDFDELIDDFAAKKSRKVVL